MKNTAVTLEEFSVKLASNCQCKTEPCNCNAIEPEKPLIASPEEIKQSLQNASNKTKAAVKNPDFQKGALLVSALVCIYVILK